MNHADRKTNPGTARRHFRRSGEQCAVAEGARRDIVDVSSISLPLPWRAGVAHYAACRSLRCVSSPHPTRCAGLGRRPHHVPAPGSRGLKAKILSLPQGAVSSPPPLPSLGVHGRVWEAPLQTKTKPGTVLRSQAGPVEVCRGFISHLVIARAQRARGNPSSPLGTRGVGTFLAPTRKVPKRMGSVRAVMGSGVRRERRGKPDGSLRGPGRVSPQSYGLDRVAHRRGVTWA